MFKLNFSGFQIPFPNGLVLSTTFNFGSYCDNLGVSELINRSIFDVLSCQNVEVAIIYSGNFVTAEILGCDDDVKGYVKIEEWHQIVEKLRNFDVSTIEKKHSALGPVIFCRKKGVADGKEK